MFPLYRLAPWLAGTFSGWHAAYAATAEAIAVAGWAFFLNKLAWDDLHSKVLLTERLKKVYVAAKNCHKQDELTAERQSYQKHSGQVRECR